MSKVTLDDLRADFLAARKRYSERTDLDWRDQRRKSFDIPQFASYYDFLVQQQDYPPETDPGYEVAKLAKQWMVWLTKGKNGALLWKLAN
ncbi:hypothetical protein AX777_05825 [Sphingobium yanoikuyae]|uniref:Uncharacterized protein n=1 Tax=Sphingobium yanoikuyae TaxID=13690 RepID=A0A177JR54_SPHYA|nr:hypothetical protein [Sphingobium yanoikuyae]OAH42755.1 hypothetical protein AX777_05825 [Sphingobium yanoikuyae]